jgi:23S rRNA pseudouridine2605 synthase
MRINKFVAQASGLSRRAADQAIGNGRVTINGQPAALGDDVNLTDVVVRLDDRQLELPQAAQTIMLNKPAGYVCSRDGQGSATVYDLLPPEFQSLKSVGRLDKNSSGLLLLTSDGQLANELTHPRYVKEKVYEVGLNRQLTPEDAISLEQGIELEDGVSHLKLRGLTDTQLLRISMTEGRNRQIRRTFDAIGYIVRSLHRTHFGPYELGQLRSGQFKIIED